MRVLITVAAVLLLAACTRPRTQIMLRVTTDMTQGPDQTLGSIRVRVWNEDEETLAHDQTYVLGDDLRLPAELALIPDQQREALVVVEVEARGPDGALLFAKPARARYRPEETLLLTVVLADRCRAATLRECPEGQSCGAVGCESNLRSDPPDYTADAGPGVDAGPEPCADRCGGECVDTLTDVAHCGGCGLACDAPENADSSCAVGSCGYSCREGFHACGDACLGNGTVDSCGDRCAPCPTPSEGGIAICEAEQCAVVCDPGLTGTDGECVPGPNVDPPRPIAPRSFGRVTSTRPTFRWALAPGSDGVLLEICRDAGCAEIVSVHHSARGATELTLATELAPRASGSRRLYFRLFGRSGGSTGASPSATWSFVLPARTAGQDTSLGVTYDVENDGLADLAVGSTGDRVVLYRGRASGIEPIGRELTQTAGSAFGVAVAAAGDVNGDGFGDLVVGAPGIRRAYLYLGASDGLASTPVSLVGGAAGSDFGRAVARAGDVNGDGYGDVMVGAPGEGSVSVFLGGETFNGTADLVLRGPDASGFGASLAALDDADIDGFDDLAIGAPDEGAVYVFRGEASPSGSRLAEAADVRLEGSAVEAFGTALAAGLDVDGDGRGDLLVSAPRAAIGADGVHLFLGASGGVASEAASSWGYPVGAPSSTDLGAALASAGDFNRDGLDDWVVGAPGASSAFLYRGTEAGGEAAPSGTFSRGAGGRLGAAVSSPGDIDGDGYDDTVVGDPEGREVRVFRHGAGGVDDTGASVTSSTTAGFGAALTWAPPTCPLSEVPT